jgi:hypothetical protein
MKIEHEAALAKLTKEREDFARRYGLPTDLNPVDNILQFVLIVAACVPRLPGLIFSLIKVTIVCYFLFGVTYFAVHDLTYGTMHYVVDPVITEAIKLINSITSGIMDAVNKVLKAAESIGNAVRSATDFLTGKKHKHKITINSVKKFKIDKSTLGRDYDAMVNLKRLCKGFRHHGLAEFHIVMQALTGHNLCLVAREVSPSPWMVYLGVLLYDRDFATPEGRNCHADKMTGYCFAWILPYVFLTFLQVYTTVRVVFFFKPPAMFILSHIAAYVFTVEYMLTHGSQHADFVLDYHLGNLTAPSGPGHLALRQHLLKSPGSGKPPALVI